MQKEVILKSSAIVLTGLMLAGTVLTACRPDSKNKNSGTGTTSSIASNVVKSSLQSTEKALSKISNETSNEISSETSKKVDFESYVNEVDKLVKLNWPLMNKVWPGYDYTSHNFLIFNLDEDYNIKEARLLSVTENRKLKKSEYEGITPPNPQGYDQIKFQGKHSIVMSVDDDYINSKNSVDDFYKTATHEMVHFYYQRGVKANVKSSRSQIYPIELAPRIYRRMQYTRLIQAFENLDKRDEYLGKAKFWLDKYNAEYKKEAVTIRATDIAEGTARYTENIGTFIGKTLSKNDFKKEADKLIPKDQIFVAADKESYEIGYVAALLFDEKDPKWKDKYYSTGKGIPEEFYLKM